MKISETFPSHQMSTDYLKMCRLTFILRKNGSFTDKNEIENVVQPKGSYIQNHNELKKYKITTFNELKKSQRI